MSGVSRLAMALSVSVLLAACGGGNNDDGSGTGPGTAPTFVLGSGSGGSFSAGSLDIGTTDLAGNDSTTVSASIADESGNLFTEAASVTFRSDCTATDQATIGSPVDVVDGFATTTYTPQGCTGDDTITASVDIDGDTSNASGPFTFTLIWKGDFLFTDSESGATTTQGAADTGSIEITATTPQSVISGPFFITVTDN